MIPSVQECYRLMDAYGMLDNIKAHSVVVAKVARVIARGLRDAHIAICMETVTAGSLLHDIGKTASLQTGEDHSEIGRQICLDNRLDEIAPIVGEHVRLQGYSLNGGFSEKEIVFYADKRVKHDQVVSLDERLAYIIERYGRGREDLMSAIRANFSLCSQVQDKLFKNLPFSPDALPHMTADADILL
jgi:uncharacterized protein